VTCEKKRSGKDFGGRSSKTSRELNYLIIIITVIITLLTEGQRDFENLVSNVFWTCRTFPLEKEHVFTIRTLSYVV